MHAQLVIAASEWMKLHCGDPTTSGGARVLQRLPARACVLAPQRHIDLARALEAPSNEREIGLMDHAMHLKRVAQCRIRRRGAGKQDEPARLLVDAMNRPRPVQGIRPVVGWRERPCDRMRSSAAE